MQEELDDSPESKDVTWEKSENVQIPIKHGKTRKVTACEETPKAREMFKYLTELLKTFPAHQFRAS